MPAPSFPQTIGSLAAIIKPPSARERAQLALLQAETARDAFRAGAVTEGRTILNDAIGHLRALLPLLAEPTR